MTCEVGLPYGNQGKKKNNEYLEEALQAKAALKEEKPESGDQDWGHGNCEGRGRNQWSMWIKVIIGVHGLWNIVKNGVKKSEDDSELTVGELNAFKKNNGDQSALTIIHQGLGWQHIQEDCQWDGF